MTELYNLVLDCPEGWEPFSETSHHCYKPFSERVDWPAAEENCQKAISAGHLISIHHETKNAHAKALFNSVDDGNMWIGAERNEVNGFSWSDGKEMTFTKWGREEPAGDSEPEKKGCSKMDRDSYWSESLCTENYGYTCQVPRLLSNCVGKSESERIPCNENMEFVTENYCSRAQCCWNSEAITKCYQPDVCNYFFCYYFV